MHRLTILVILGKAAPMQTDAGSVPRLQRDIDADIYVAGAVTGVDVILAESEAIRSAGKLTDRVSACRALHEVIAVPPRGARSTSDAKALRTLSQFICLPAVGQ